MSNETESAANNADVCLCSWTWCRLLFLDRFIAGRYPRSGADDENLYYNMWIRLNCLAIPRLISITTQLIREMKITENNIKLRLINYTFSFEDRIIINK